MTVLSVIPGVAFPQHLSGKTNTVQSYLLPGAVQLNVTGKVLSPVPGIPFSQNLSGKTNTVQNYLYPGAVQPPQPAPGLGAEGTSNPIFRPRTPTWH